MKQSHPIGHDWEAERDAAAARAELAAERARQAIPGARP